MAKRLHTLLTLISLSSILSAQMPVEKATVKGKLVFNNSNIPTSQTAVHITALKLMVFTDNNGEFSFGQIPYGSYEIEAGDSDTSFKILVDEPLINLGTISIIQTSEISNTELQIPGLAFDDVISTDINDAHSSVFIPNISSTNHNPIITTSVSHFLPFGFRLRGYKSNRTEVYMNGLLTNDLLSGNPNQNQWAGLNDIFSNASLNLGLQYNENAFGGIAGMSVISAYASGFKRQTNIAYTRTNRTFNNQYSLAHHTGMMQNGWAVSAAANIRQANEGYIPGTFYESYGYGIAISKSVSEKNKIHLLGYGSSIYSSNTSPATEEVIQLAGSNYYNPNWGYQNGEKRNAKENKTFLPVTMLNWEFTQHNSLVINVGLAYQTGYNGYSSLDWYNAADPRPDYYANLPSYFFLNPQGANEEEAMRRTLYYQNNPDALQINWGKMYDANRINRQTINGVTGNRSVYALGEDRNDLNVYSAFGNFQKVITKRLSLSGGASYQIQGSEHYRLMLDLLGGDFYVNHNRFAERTFTGNDQYKQNDLNNTNRMVHVGDKYNYYYKAHLQKGLTWLQAVYYLSSFDFYIAARGGVNNFYRDGQYRNGVFSNESYGKSAQQQFFTAQIKGGITYKINGRHNVFVNAAYIQEAPTFDNIFIAPRIRNTTIEDPLQEKISSMELGYLLHHQKLSLGFTVYTCGG